MQIHNLVKIAIYSNNNLVHHCSKTIFSILLLEVTIVSAHGAHILMDQFGCELIHVE